MESGDYEHIVPDMIPQRDPRWLKGLPGTMTLHGLGKQTRGLHAWLHAPAQLLA